MPKMAKTKKGKRSDFRDLVESQGQSVDLDGQQPSQHHQQPAAQAPATQPAATPTPSVIFQNLGLSKPTRHQEPAVQPPPSTQQSATQLHNQDQPTSPSNQPTNSLDQPDQPPAPKKVKRGPYKKEILKTVGQQNKHAEKKKRHFEDEIKDLKRRTGLSASYFMWKPDQGGFVAYGSGNMSDFVQDPIVLERLNFHMEKPCKGDEAVEEQVQTWDSSVNLPHDWREQHAHDKCKMISDIVRAEVRDGSSTGAIKKNIRWDKAKKYVQSWWPYGVKCGPPSTSSTDAEMTAIIEAWCAANSARERSEINECCAKYVEAGQIDSDINLVKNKLKMATCLEKKPSFENCSPLGLVRVNQELHAVCDGAQDLFQSVSTCYFGSPVYWPMLKVAASLFQDEPDDEHDTTVVADSALQRMSQYPDKSEDILWYLEGLSSYLGVNIIANSGEGSQVVGEDGRFNVGYKSELNLLIEPVVLPLCPVVEEVGSDCWANPFCTFDSGDRPVRDSMQCPDCLYSYHNVCVGIRPRGDCGCSSIAEIAERLKFLNDGSLVKDKMENLTSSTFKSQVANINQKLVMPGRLDFLDRLKNETVVNVRSWVEGNFPDQSSEPSSYIRHAIIALAQVELQETCIDVRRALVLLQRQ